MSPRQMFTVRGKVLQADGKPLVGAEVRAFELGKNKERFLGKAQTKQDGLYEIKFASEQKTLNLIIRVYDGDTLLGQSLVTPQTTNQININLRVGPAEAPGELECRVHGVVHDADGNPLPEVAVYAFARYLRSEQTLGQARTDEEGLYEIRYSKEQFRLRKKGGADLVVKAFAADGSLLVASKPLFDAPQDAEVNLKIPAEVLSPPTLFEGIKGKVMSLVEDGKVEDLEEDQYQQDLSFLSGKTGFEKDVLARFVIAHKLAQQAIQVEFWFALLGGSFYEYNEKQSLNKQLAIILESLPSLDAKAVDKALTRAINLREIAEAFQEKSSDWIEAFLQFTASYTVRQTDEPTFVKSALELAGIKESAKQEKFARLFNEYRELTPAMVDALEKDKDFNKAEIADLQTTFRLSDLIRGDFSVVKMLKEGFQLREPDQIRPLAKMSEEEWVKLVEEKHAAGEIKLPFEFEELPEQVKLPEAELYGKTLEHQFRQAFPTTAFSGGLERAIDKGEVRGIPHAEILAGFLNTHPNFEFLNTPVDEFLINNPDPNLRTLAGDDGFKLEAKAVQRIFKLAPTFAATDTLLADGIHSAQKIYRMGETAFARRYADRPGFTKERARAAWNRAADTYAAVLTIIGDLKSLQVDTLPMALKNKNQGLSDIPDGLAVAGAMSRGVREPATDFPNWEKLFQAGDLCECEDCRSLLSPAAYFADILMFLSDRSSENSRFPTVKDILLQRRPDLGYLELSCENAQTPLPYIDVVCEVLEAAVAGVAGDENDLELIGFTEMPADPAAAKDAVREALANKIDLGSDFSLSQVDSEDPDRWVAHGEDLTCLLKKKSTPNFFAEILPNTKTSAAELRAYPQYVNPKAYQKLEEAKYPLSLPFDLYAEEVRAAIQKTNLPRWDLMRTFRSAPNSPTDAQIAAEYFGISADPDAQFDEMRLIFAADPTIEGQQAVWGETGNDLWLDTTLDTYGRAYEKSLCNVRYFLQKTGLEYNELLALLDLDFINPTYEVIIDRPDPSCDTDKQLLKTPTPENLDRIHRFLRLWRKLKNWKMWELDLVIGHPGIGSRDETDNPMLDERFLVNLFYFSEIRKKLGSKATVEQVCALFAELNTETRFTNLHEKRQDALYQNLFLNKRIMHPVDPAFQLDPETDDLATGDSIDDHLPVILAALGIREADLDLLKGLTRADGIEYIDNDLTLRNLSFLWRHAWLSRTLKYKVEDWKTLLKIFQQDVLKFDDPKMAWEFLEKIDHFKACGFTPNELNWLLTADLTAKAAAKEADAARFLTALRNDLQIVKDEYDPAQYDFLIVIPPTDTARLAELLTSILQKLNRDESAAQFFVATLRNEGIQEKVVAGLGTIAFPPAIPISYDATRELLRFTGFMTEDQKNALPEVPGNAEYQAAIEEFYNRPRLALKFFEPVFTASLATLPRELDFKDLPDPALTAKISHDAEQQLLRFAGIMTEYEKTALDDLSTNPDYRVAVDSLFNQPTRITRPDERIWLLDEDLQFPLRDLMVSANDHLAENLAKAVTKALAYLSNTLSEDAVIQQTSAQLGLTEAVTRILLSRYDMLPDSLLTHLTREFASTGGAVSYEALKTTFDGWFWANRVAAMLKKWKITFAEWEIIFALTSNAQLLDFKTLPLDGTGTIPSMDLFLRTSRLMRLRDSLPEPQTTLLEVLEKLNSGGYATTDLAAGVERLNEDWLATDVEALIVSLDLNYPTGYLLAENWERLRRAFYFLGNLNANADRVKTFAVPAMTEDHAKTLKSLLRSKFGAETWLSLSEEIQDALRERKRDALAAYLLSQSRPEDAPSGKWENTNDLYAYYLLDVEMSSCQLTSRLVQASGSVQLFVQRCFMGLEPDVVVRADGEDGDSAWRWWKWMHKYRLWEANRKVFLWPENWIEPELKKDRSPFFKGLENELLQNEINQHTVETAFANYLEKLDGVAQLEIAGLYQEDDSDNTILHVFGRTSGGEPHLYYYRRYDYRQWTPWEKVELDIQGDYLIPAVVNKRLFLFWPVFTEVPDEERNNLLTIPAAASEEQEDQEIPQTWKKLRLQMAMSEYRQGNWSPKKVSKNFAESTPYDVHYEIYRKQFIFSPIDLTEVRERLDMQYIGAAGRVSETNTTSLLRGAFAIDGCNGVPDITDDAFDNWFASDGYRFADQPEQSWYTFRKFVENNSRSSRNDFTVYNLSPSTRRRSSREILRYTPGVFKMTTAWHLSYMDKLGFYMVAVRPVFPEETPTFGTWLPFFYNDQKRTFFVLALFNHLSSERSGRNYYPDIKQHFREQEDVIEEDARNYAENRLSGYSDEAWRSLEPWLQERFPFEETPRPYTKDQVRSLLARWYMESNRYYGPYVDSEYFFRSPSRRQFHFKNYYHPFVCDFAKLIHNPLKGIPALMSRETQFKNTGFKFYNIYQPTIAVVEATEDPDNPHSEYYPKEVVDFSPDGAYSPYNWELFFHAPLLIANLLSKNQRFEEAREWYHFIFNPIGVESPPPEGDESPMRKYWITKPFYETTDSQYVQQRIDHILRLLAGDTELIGDSPGDYADQEALDQAKRNIEAQIFDWRTYPFEPHRIANYRTVAYQKTVVMKYLDNLIAWGDYLFRQDSMESINEATQLYILAAEILGPRPKIVPPPGKPPLKTFNELEQEFEEGRNRFADPLVNVENFIPVMPGEGNDEGLRPPLPMLYFCIPQNDKMLGYWDTVADRLYKIRNCMNIEGVVRQLALFEPPIDPGALVKAVAGGVDISSALADLDAPLPLYRFHILLQKANELCSDVKVLGSALLAALEKKDAEALAMLRQGQEIQLLEAVKAVREIQIEEARENLEAMKRSKELAELRKKYYESREFMNTGESIAKDLSIASTLVDSGIALAYILAGGLKALPQFLVGASGFGGSPHAIAETGGKTFGEIAEDTALTLSSISRALDKGASLASTMAGYERRQEEWNFQMDLAVKEIGQSEQQIAAAELRIAIAEKELENHVLQIENARATDAFMRSKYTNEELYQWQVGQISGVYFQSYKLAYDLAKRAERCFRFELGVQDSNYINFGYWDSLKKGLLSGEKLQYDLRRLEAAYLEQNRREFELAKHISLALLDPLALVQLRETGRCFFRMPEEIFDLDYPGHYFRRIKSVSLTLPCVTGPYTTISCTLRLLKNSVRINAANGDNGYARNTNDQGLPADDERFVENNIPVKAIAASSAQNDSGVFELSFRDERYLPFEGAGAVSEWSLELFNDLPSNNPDPENPDFGKPLRQFDYNTISDAILHVKYTAREDAGPFKDAAVAHLRAYFSEENTTPSLRMFNLRQEFPTQWHRFLHPANPADGNALALEISPGLFPIRDQEKTLKINMMWLLARCTDADGYNVIMRPPLPEPTDSEAPDPHQMALVQMDQYGGLHVHEKDVSTLGIEVLPTDTPVNWQIKMARSDGGNLEVREVEDMLLVLGYEWE